MLDAEWKLGFKISDGCQFRYERDGMTVFEASLENGKLRISMLFTANQTPLTLTADAQAGDHADFVYRPYRMELSVNGCLCDEEWQFGDNMLDGASLTQCNTALDYSSAPAIPVPEAVTGSFINAEGWRPGGGVYVGDCMPYVYDGRYHVLYLKDRHHHHSKWGKGAHQWEHISSADLVHWDIHPMAVAIDDSSEGSICTGSWIYENGRHTLYYTVRKSDGSAATIERSVSEDGYHFAKDRSFRFTLSDRYTAASARDPKVIRGQDGLMHMFVTTTDLVAEKGCLAHLVSGDGEKWEETGNIYTSPDRDEPECSDYFMLGNRYYLIFSHHGSAGYMYSDKPFSEWKRPENPHIPCSSVPKAAIWNNRLIFTGFKGIDGYAGTMTFTEAIQKPDGEFDYK